MHKVPLYVYIIPSPLVFHLIAKLQYIPRNMHTVFALLCFVVVIHWQIFPYPSVSIPYQSNDCPSSSKATLMNMDKYFMWIHYERFHNHNKAKHNKTVCIFLGIYCTGVWVSLCWLTWASRRLNHRYLDCLFDSLFKLTQIIRVLHYSI